MSKMKTLMAVVLAMLSVILLSPADLYAQAGATGAITGTVLDQKGGAIAGAIVVVTNLATGQKEREVVSTGAGTFNIPSLPPSRYSLEITATGFSKFVVANVLVQVTETTSVNATLVIGQVTINVNGQRPTNNNFQLEGVNANDVNLPVLDNVPLPNPDTIQEFKTQT